MEVFLTVIWVNLKILGMRCKASKRSKEDGKVGSCFEHELLVAVRLLSLGPEFEEESDPDVCGCGQGGDLADVVPPSGSFFLLWSWLEAMSALCLCSR